MTGRPALPNTDPTALYRWRDGLYAADLLTAALVWLDLFSWLDEHPSDLDGICAGLGLPRAPGRRDDRRCLRRWASSSATAPSSA